MNPLKTLSLIAVLFVLVLCVDRASAQFANVSIQHQHTGGPLHFIENKKQWPDEVLFKTNFEGTNTLFIERQGFTYLLTSPEDLNNLFKNHVATDLTSKKAIIRQHAFKVKFLDSWPAEAKGIAKRSVYHNYFLGNNPDNWAGQVGLFGKVQQRNVYPGIHLETYSQNGHLKYDFLIEPLADPSQIKMEYTGVDRLALVEGNLQIQTSVGVLNELSPVAWQEMGNSRVHVPCYFRLENNIVSYSFPDGYDISRELVIDPVVITATMTGTPGISSSLGNWGHSATYDNGGNIYAAGRSFVTTFPTSTGAFQTDFSGGDVDMAIIKYNPDGSNMIYATYIGGDGDDLPHSIVADFNQQLYIYGSTSSSDYPVTANAFQSNPGGSIDIFVTVLNQAGTALVGSSYFGGYSDDGYNENFASMTHSYGDEYRGEIVIDGQNNIYVVSNSQSINFPTTTGAYDNTITNTGYTQDAVVFKANSDLSILFWSTYLGGTGLDSGNGIRIDDEKNVYVTGTAGGSNFPTTPGTYQTTWPGGNESGYLVKLSSNGSTLLASTFFGTSGNDNSYFVDIDEDKQVHIFGKTTGNVPISPQGVYSGIPGSHQFLAAFSNDLKESIYTTVIGKGPSTLNYDFIPVAFMVDKCNGIYFSGYEALPGLPVSPGTMPDTDPTSNDIYIGVLTPNATNLNYATYYREADHVDGGTSRFDKGGIVYQAVCSCDWSGNLITTPNAWATAQQTGCDIGVFKIDLEIEAINASGIAYPSNAGCAPFDVDFEFTGSNAETFEWSIENVVVSNAPNHSYTFENAGTYQVQLVISNPSACNPTDTFLLEIDVLDGQSTSTDTTYCMGNELYLDATTPNGTYSWQDGSTVSTYTVQEPGVYWVDISIVGCERRDSFIVNAYSEVTIDLGPDTSFCDVQSYLFSAYDPGILSYQWHDGSTEHFFSATEDGSISVTGLDTNGCFIVDEIALVFGQTPSAELGEDLSLCHQETWLLSPDLQNSQPLWQDGSTGSSFLVETPGIYSIQLNNDGCTDTDTITVSYFSPIEPNAAATSIICANECNGTAFSTPIGGAGTGFNFIWSNGDTQSYIENLCPSAYTVTITDQNDCSAIETVEVSAPLPLEIAVTINDVKCAGDMNGSINVSSVSGGVTPYLYSFNNAIFNDIPVIDQLGGGIYEVSVQDANGCTISDTVTIYEPEEFIINAGQAQTIQLGEIGQLRAMILPFTNQEIEWSPADFLDCTDCPNPNLCPTFTTWYTLLVTDPVTGCFMTDSVLVTVNKERKIYIPNAFSPNDDGANDFFTIFAGPGVLKITEMKVFDRWGEMVFENYDFPPNDLSLGWDGTFKNEDLNPGVFSYFAKVMFKDEITILYEGNVHLLK